MLTPYDLTCEYFTDPVGLDVLQPRLSWKSNTDQRGAAQTAYQIIAADNSAALEVAAANQTAVGVLWNTGKVKSAVSLLVPYEGAALQPGQRFLG